MFCIGFSEIIIIAIIALVVLGPDKLPGMAAKAGRMFWEVRRAWDDVADTVRTEMMTVQKPLDDLRRAGRETRDLFNAEARKMKDEADQAVTETKSAADAVKDAPPEVKPAEPAGPQPFKPAAPPRVGGCYYDLDGNAMDEPPEGGPA